MAYQLEQDLAAIRSIILPHYQCREDEKHKGSIRCISAITLDGMSEQQWDHFKDLVRKHFKERLMEFYHHTNSDHVDFVVYLKPHS